MPFQDGLEDRVKRQTLVALLGIALATSVGCGDDSAGGSGDGTGTESGTSTGDDTTGSMMTMTTMSADSSTGGAGSGDQGSEDSSGSSGDPAGVTVSGLVEDLNPLAMMPIPGASISVFDDDTITATASAVGEYEIGPVPANAFSTFLVAPSELYMGSVIPIDIGDGPTQEDEQLARVSREFIDDQIALLEDGMPLDPAPDLDQAIVIVRLLSSNVLAEGNVTVTMDPAPVAGTFYAPDSEGAPVLDSNEMAFAFLPVVVYFNIAPDAPGAYGFTFDHPTSTCDVVYTDVPTVGEHISLVDVRCE